MIKLTARVVPKPNDAHVTAYWQNKHAKGAYKPLGREFTGHAVGEKPTDNDIAQAMIVAKRHMPGELLSRVEFVALKALATTYPSVSRASLAARIGINVGSNLHRRLQSSMEAKWWPAGAVMNQIVRELADGELVN